MRLKIKNFQDSIQRIEKNIRDAKLELFELEIEKQKLEVKYRLQNKEYAIFCSDEMFKAREKTILQLADIVEKRERIQSDMKGKKDALLDLRKEWSKLVCASVDPKIEKLRSEFKKALSKLLDFREICANFDECQKIAKAFSQLNDEYNQAARVLKYPKKAIQPTPSFQYENFKQFLKTIVENFNNNFPLKIREK